MECKRCGDCCQSGTLLKQSTKAEKLLFRFIYKLMGEDINSKACPHLEFVMGLAVCKIYENRPQFCRDYFCNKC